MRQILFRGKRLNWKEFSSHPMLGECEWIYGDLLCVTQEPAIASRESMHVSDEPGVCVETDLIAVDSETVCQYTELTDRDNTTIFENDIVEGKDNAGFLYRGVVKYGMYISDAISGFYEYGFYIDWIGFTLRRDITFWHRKMKVIGSVFDNPEIVDKERARYEKIKILSEKNDRTKKLFGGKLG